MLKCAFRSHEAGPRTIWNDGLWFGSCRHCGRDLIRHSDKWKAVGKGKRVVWRPRGDRQRIVVEAEASSAGLSAILMTHDFGQVYAAAADRGEPSCDIRPIGAAPQGRHEEQRRQAA